MFILTGISDRYAGVVKVKFNRSNTGDDDVLRGRKCAYWILSEVKRKQSRSGHLVGEGRDSN